MKALWRWEVLPLYQSKGTYFSTYVPVNQRDQFSHVNHNRQALICKMTDFRAFVKCLYDQKGQEMMIKESLTFDIASGRFLSTSVITQMHSWDPTIILKILCVHATNCHFGLESSPNTSGCLSRRRTSQFCNFRSRKRRGAGVRPAEANRKKFSHLLS